MFSCVPIPFVKQGGLDFSQTAFGKFISRIKNSFDKVADAVSNFFKDNFRNPLQDKIKNFKETKLDPLDKDIASPFESLNNEIDEFVADDYNGLKKLFGDLAGSGDGSIQATFNALELSLGKAQNFSDNYKIGPFTLGQ